MARKAAYILAAVSVSFLASGCVVRTYQVTRDRVDQDLAGNRGYLHGALPAAQEEAQRPARRDSRVVEVELRNPLKFHRKAAKPKPAIVPDEVKEDKTAAPGPTLPGTQAAMEKYTVQKNETLQKISQKLYGTTKKWTKIFDANKDVLKAPDKVYAGQVINVPVEEGVSKPHNQGNLK